MSAVRSGTPDDGDDPFDESIDVPKGGFRDRIRDKPGLGQAYRLGIFVLGLAFIALGVALAVLPGPLTIPPVLLGLYIWSTEFRFAEKLFDRFQEKAKEAWEHAKKKPKSSAAITVGGLILAGVAFWAVGHYELVDKAKDFVGL
jgi:hypothetical protein